MAPTVPQYVGYQGQTLAGLGVPIPPTVAPTPVPIPPTVAPVPVPRWIPAPWLAPGADPSYPYPPGSVGEHARSQLQVDPLDPEHPSYSSDRDIPVPAGPPKKLGPRPPPRTPEFGYPKPPPKPPPGPQPLKQVGKAAAQAPAKAFVFSDPNEAMDQPRHWSPETPTQHGIVWGPPLEAHLQPHVLNRGPIPPWRRNKGLMFQERVSESSKHDYITANMIFTCCIMFTANMIFVTHTTDNFMCWNIMIFYKFKNSKFHAFNFKHSAFQKI